MHDTSAIKLTAEAYSANQRLAEALSRSGDFSGILPLLLDALNSGGAQAAVEINDLIEQLEARLPGHGKKLARELGQNGVALQGGPDGGGLVQVDAYTQDRDGTATAVRAHTRGGPESVGGAETKTKADVGPGRFYSPNDDDYFKSDGKIEKGRPTPTLKNPIPDGKMRGGNSGHFDARRKNDKKGYYYQHGGVDVLAKPGTPTTAVADGEVTAIGTSGKAITEDGDDLLYVETTTKDGYKVRQHYIKPSVKVGDKVRSGNTQIGNIQDLSPNYGPTMPNHTHVEVYDSKTIVENGKNDIKKFKRVDPAPFMGM